MQNTSPNIDQQERFRRLQEILFEQDRQVTELIQKEVENLKDDLVSPEEVRERVQPLIENKITYLQENFPELFGPILAETIKKQIHDQQDEMIDALYPIIGKLIRKFLTKEMEALIERLDTSINNTFSWQGIKSRFRSWFKGESEKDRVVRSIARPVVEEVFIVDQDSGLIAGAWSRQELADRDMVAGMLTAIKSFVESAFDGGSQDLETIEYDSFKIILHNFHTFYIAVVASGVLTADFKNDLSVMLMAFAEKHRIDTRDDLDETTVGNNSKALKAYFDEFSDQSQ